MAAPTFDFFYGDESGQFSFFRIPRQLVTDKRFSRVSTDAKLLYGLLLDRMGLSAKNGWYDEQGRVYIYYTLEEIQADYECGHDKATKLLAELDSVKGIGLIERVRQGQGKPTKIYVKRFTTGQMPGQTEEPQTAEADYTQSYGEAEVQTAEKPALKTAGKAAVKTAGKPALKTSAKAAAKTAEKPAASYTDRNYPDLSYPEGVIHLSPTPSFAQGMDGRRACKESVERQIESDHLCLEFDADQVDGLVELLTDVLCSTRPTLRVGGEDVPTAQVKQRLSMLDCSHVEYVFDCLRDNDTEVRNIRAYLLTALYNAPVTMEQFYQSASRFNSG